MNDTNKTSSTRRAFFLKGSAAIGAGLASATAGASSLVFDDSLPLKNRLSQLQYRLADLEDREAIRQLHLAYTGLLEKQAFDEAAELFTQDAEIFLDGESFRGKELKRLFGESDESRQSRPLQTAFRQDQASRQDTIEISDDGLSAGAVFHFQVEISVPHEEDSVLAEMAKLQGQYASRRWVNGKFEVAYRREQDQWKISRLEFSA